MSTQTLPERTGITTFQGNPMTLVGHAVAVGDAAPDFFVVDASMKPITLNDVTAGGTRAALLIAVPSLDTPVCNIESRRFNERLAEFPKGVSAYVISMDLPFAQKRWCGDDGEIALGMLSDYRERSFGHSYGVFVKELALLARATFVVSADKKITYSEITADIAQEPNYDAAVAAALAAAK